MGKAQAEVAIWGGGGREFEIGRAVGESREVREVSFYPGNAGTELLPNSENFPDPLGELPKEVFVIIGPEAPLIAGEADRLRANGNVVFGPTAIAARLEGSKGFAVDFMRENAIPHPESDFVSNISESLKYVNFRRASDYVIKADGPAAGKGVILPKDHGEALKTISGMMDGSLFDGAGATGVVFQERLHGPELTVSVVSDGTDFAILPLAQDHKRLLDGDSGPNTGGMGAYAPAGDSLTDRQHQKIKSIVEATIKGMADRGTPYQGWLYVQLMLAKERAGDPVVIEYNCRFGDPETQVVLPLVQKAGVDVYRLLRSAAEGKLKAHPEFLSKLGGAALTVCLAAEGYPDNPQKGVLIEGLDKKYKDVILHHAGTKKTEDGIVTSGGRVLYVTGLGKNVDDAAARAYAAIGEDGVHFPGMQYRKDIGHQARSSKS